MFAATLIWNGLMMIILSSFCVEDDENQGTKLGVALSIPDDGHSQRIIIAISEFLSP